jgi:flagellar basal body-associated protein FliL
MQLLRLRLQRMVLLVLLVPLFASTACKTSTDAKAAATQLTATAKALSDYYTALDTLLGNTDQLYALQESLGGPAYDATRREHVRHVKEEVGKRAALAKTFTSIAASFASLSGSTAATDVPASATKLEAQIVAVGGIGAPSQQQLGLMTTALQVFVTAYQEHKERQAAAAIDRFSGALSQLVAGEAELYDSYGSQYLSISSSVAVGLVRAGRVDPSALLKPALDPFGLTALPAGAELRAQFGKQMETQIKTKTEALLKSQQDATAALKKALEDASHAVHLVVTDKPLEADKTPLTLDTVETWATKVAAL